jgi:branched-chain amino acid transport system ATP-binding protein
MTSPLLLEIDELTAGYGGAAAIRDLSLTASEGEIVALIGPNGAGKTTTLRVISALIRPMRGSVVFAGSNVARIAPHKLARHGIAHVPEGRGIFFGLTVAEHMRLGDVESRRAAAEAYEYFPALYELRYRKAGLLSGGEQQMLALAGALIRRPRLLLVDELSLGLAPIIVERLFRIVRQLSDDTGTAVVLVEQHVQLALEIADTCCVLSHGRMLHSGPAAALRNDRQLLVSSYLGEHQAALAAERIDVSPG